MVNIDYEKQKPAEENDAVIRKFPFAKDQPKWVLSLLQDQLNLRHVFDVIKFFNMGGEIVTD